MFNEKYAIWSLLDGVLDFGEYPDFNFKDYVAALNRSDTFWKNPEHGLYFLSKDAQHSGKIASVPHHINLKNVMLFQEEEILVISGDFSGVILSDAGYETIYANFKLNFNNIKNVEFNKKEYDLKEMKVKKTENPNLVNFLLSHTSKNSLYLSQIYQDKNRILIVFNARVNKDVSSEVSFYELSFDYSDVVNETKLIGEPKNQYYYPDFETNKKIYKGNLKFKKRKMKKRNTPKRLY